MEFLEGMKDFQVWCNSRNLLDSLFHYIKRKRAEGYGVPRPFRFADNWLLHDDFLELCKQIWKRANISGWAGYKNTENPEREY